MAGQEWGTTTVGGFLSNQELSLELHEQAQPLMRWVQFCDTDENFGANHGDTLLFNKILNVDTEGGVISESGELPETQGKIRQSSAVIQILGNTIPYTEYLMRLSKFDLRNMLHRWLINDMAKVLNRKAATQFQATKVKYTPQGDAANPSAAWDVDGTISNAASRSIGVWDIIEIIEAMKSGIFGSGNTASPVPPYDDDGNYVCICSPGFASAMRRDDDFINASLYGDPERLFAGEIGRFHGVRFIEDNHILTNALGTTTYKGEAVIFGAETVKRIVALPAEIREDLPTNLGLKRRQGWVAFEAFKIIWEYVATTEPENRIVHVTST